MLIVPPVTVMLPVSVLPKLPMVLPVLPASSNWLPMVLLLCVQAAIVLMVTAVTLLVPLLMPVPVLALYNILVH